MKSSIILKEKAINVLNSYFKMCTTYMDDSNQSYAIKDELKRFVELCTDGINNLEGTPFHTNHSLDEYIYGTFKK